MFALAVPAAQTEEAGDTPFTNGRASAVGIVAKVAPGIGGLELGMTTGVAIAEVTNQLAQAQARAVDLGLLGTALTGEGCTGGAPLVTPSQLPQYTRVDNRHGDAEASEVEIPLLEGVLGSGWKWAKATTQPLGHAIATNALLSLDPLVRVNGGHSEAMTRVIPGEAREALATVDLNLNLGGLVQLHGLSWKAFHRTGARPEAHGSFNLEGATLAGLALPLSSDDLAGAQTILNQLLAPTGLIIELPTVERVLEPNDLVRVTPLRIMFKDSPAGAAVLGPVLGLVREQKESLFEQLAEAFCQAAGALLVGDIVITALAGSGFVTMEVGGATALSNAIDFEDPFVGDDSLLPPIEIPGVPGVLPPIVIDVPISVGSGSTPEVAAAPRPVAATGPVERVCESLHPFKWPSCTHGAAVVLGFLAFLLVGGVAGADWLHQRRRTAAAKGTSL